MLRLATRSANVRSARRALLAIAVSETDAPRDGWYLSWVYGYPGQQGCPNSKSCVGFGTDYMSMGITSKYLTMESAGSTVPNQKSGGRVITIVPTAPLVAGGGAHYWQKAYPSGYPATPARDPHAPDFDHGKEALFAAPIYNLDGGAAGSRIEFRDPAAGQPLRGRPRVFTQIIAVHQFHAVGGATEPGEGRRFDRRRTRHGEQARLQPREPLPLRWTTACPGTTAAVSLTGIRVIRLGLQRRRPLARERSSG